MMNLKNVHFFRRHICQGIFRTPNISKKYHVEHLKERGVVCVKGNESTDFLQGLITNDISHLSQTGSCIYSMFLNVQGRVLFDANIFRRNCDDHLIECDRGIIQSLIKHLKIYKVRRKLHIEEDCSYSVWAVFDDNIDFDKLDENSTESLRSNQDSVFVNSQLLPSLSYVSADPRLKYLGDRVLLPGETIPSVISDASKTNGSFQILRYKLGIVEGCKEFTSGKTLPLEANCDYMHGVSFHKGCYIGQELTARSFHTGVIRKRVMPLQFEKCSSEVESGMKIINEKNKSVGKVIESSMGYGLGLMKIGPSLGARALSVEGLNIGVQTHKPRWWPIEAPKEDQRTSS